MKNSKKKKNHIHLCAIEIFFSQKAKEIKGNSHHFQYNLVEKIITMSNYKQKSK